MAKSQIPWGQIRTMWTQGQSAYSISRALSGKPTRQAIAKRAREKGWSRAVDGIVSEKHQRKHAVALGKDTPETRERIIELISNGATLKVAAAANGISRDTLLRWRRDDPAFAARCRAVRHSALAEYQGAIHSQTGRDWKAAKYMLETAPETRDDYRTDNKGGKLEVVINIDRSQGVTIDGGPVNEIEDAELADLSAQ